MVPRSAPTSTRTQRAKSVEEYIAAAPKKARGRLEEVRATIRAAAPMAREGISYSMPYFEYKGPLAWFGLHKTHVGLYLRPPIMATHRADLSGYVTTKSALHLPLDKRIPTALIKKLVRARMRLNEAEARPQT